MTLPATKDAPAAPSRYRNYLEQRPIRWWHEAIIDDMLQHPFDTLEERGRRLNYTPSGLRLIMNSDMFRAAYRQRRDRYAMILDGAIAEKLGKVAAKGLDNLLEQLETKRTALPFDKVAETTSSILEKLGFGGQKQAAGPAVVIQNNNGSGAQVVTTTASAEVLAAARDKLRSSEQQKLEEPLPEPQREAAGESRLPEAYGLSFDATQGVTLEAEIVSAPVAPEPVAGSPPSRGGKHEDLA